uniref:Uncharacterized protein n=1 Tax=Vespula pensylvanica TaxID=30213 RepID=A0A834P0L1_VESPE|nr:hypothetical protein H0235_008786 [Vespula pensylvanica]
MGEVRGWGAGGCAGHDPFLEEIEEASEVGRRLSRSAHGDRRPTCVRNFEFKGGVGGALKEKVSSQGLSLNLERMFYDATGYL